METPQLNGALDTISSMLSTDSGKQNLQSIINMIGGNIQNNSSSNSCDNRSDMSGLLQLMPNLIGSPIGNIGLGLIKRFQESYIKAQCETEGKAVFLRNISPYLSKRRCEFVEHAIKVMQFSYLPRLMKDIK